MFLSSPVRSAALREGKLRFQARSYSLGEFSIEWHGTGWHDAVLRIRHPRAPETCWETLPGVAFLVAGQGQESVRERHGMFRIREGSLGRTHTQTVDRIEATASEWRVRGELRGGGIAAPYEFVLWPVSSAALRLEARIEAPSVNRASLVFRTDPDERFFGFGAQFTYFDLRGRKVPVFVSEQGIGRGLQPLTWILDWIAGSGGAWHTTYAPVPHFLTSRLRSLALDNSEYSSFDLRATDRVEIEVFAPEIRARVYAGRTPLELIREHTAHAGRMRPLPDWIHGGIVAGMQGGTERVRTVLRQLEEVGVRPAAFWLQDWVGQRTTAFGKQLWWNWELDRTRYPQWEELVAELRAKNIRVLTYVNPFLVDVAGHKPFRRNLFQEARQRGFLVRRQNGEPYLLQVTTFPAGLLDLTNPEARAWMKEVLRENVLGVGAAGWMADFGEGLPYDAVLAAGEAREFHNRYPEEWARLNRELVDEVPGGEDLVFFTRSGFTRSPGFSTLFWLGDQLVSWDGHDGMASSVTGLLSSGLSGFAFQHGDVGGYTTIDLPLLRYRRSRELLWRWMELGAFQVVFRTHEGNLPEANEQFFSHPETLEHLAHCARLHASWYAYRKRLVREAAETGAPVARALFLHFPDDPRTWSIRNEEFLLGPDLLVAPVLKPRTESVRVYLPRGRWVHLWSGITHLGPLDIEVPAPLGHPAVFYRYGSRVGAEMTTKLGLPAASESHGVITGPVPPTSRFAQRAAAPQRSARTR